MDTDRANVEALLHFVAQAGRGQEDCEAWAHALVDIQESHKRIFEKLIPEALNQLESSREKREVLWDIREELRHIEYHLKDLEGR